MLLIYIYSFLPARALSTSSSAVAEKPRCRQGGPVLGGWWVMAWVRQYCAPNVVGTRKLKALIFYTVNPLLYEKRPLCVFESLLEVLGATYAVHLRLIGKPVWLPISHNWFFFARCFRFVTIHAFDRQTDGRTDRKSITIAWVTASQSHAN